MKSRDLRFKFSSNLFCNAFGLLTSVGLLSLGQPLLLAQQATPAAQAQSQVMTTTTTTPAPEEPAKMSNDQLDSLVAPIALYPDPLLAQTLAASTYPLEVIQLQQWMEQNKKLKDKELASAVEKQNWDPSVQAMAAFPEVLQRMAGNIQWTTDLGNAFLAQQSDVMDAVQRMRAKAESKGNLKTNEQQVVKTESVEGGKQVIVVQQAKPDVVYVPSYDPTLVYGPPPPAYPYYPYYYPGYYPGMGLAFGAGLFLGAAWGGGWGWGCGWRGGDVNINYNNKYVNHYNKQNNINRGQGSGKWQHRPEHRGNAPYGDRRTADRFGGRGPGQGATRPGGGAGNRPGGGVGTRPGGGAGARPGGGAGTRPGGGAGTRPGGGAGTRPGGGAGTRPGSGGRPSTRPSGGSGARPSTRPAGRSGATGANQVGNRSVSSRPSYSGSRGGGFGGGMSGGRSSYSGSRGGRSMGGGGFSGGGRGGGGRGGGGRRR
jgi:hypothetical protein